MPIPILLAIGCVLAGGGGTALIGKGAYDAMKAKDKMNDASARNAANLAKFEKTEKKTRNQMESLGKREMIVSKDFDRFTDAFEKIQNRPEFDSRKLGADIPEFNFAAIHTVSVAAGAFLGAAAGGATGLVFGTAAAAGTTATVMALGTASTGTAIATLSGAAATNAALAVIGGGTLAAGGGGVALGTAILGGATLGVGLLIGGAVFAFTGATLKEKAEEAYSAMLENENKIKKSISDLNEIYCTADTFETAISKIQSFYYNLVNDLENLVSREKNWDNYNDDDRRIVENNICVVQILFKMVNTPLLNATETDEDGNIIEISIDKETIDNVISSSSKALDERGIG